MLLDPLPIIPFTKPVRGGVLLPGSKSITNRALLLAALCKKTVTLTGALFSDDTQIMAKALNDLGFDVSLDEEAGIMQVAGQENSFRSENLVDIFVGNAGTAARFLTALCSAAPSGVYHLDGVPQMQRRPMRGLIDALRALGADIRCIREEGFFPIEIHAHGLRGGKVSIDASESSQMLSALIMAMAMAKEPCEIYRTKTVREPFVNMTLLIMHQFGFNASLNSETGAIWTIPSNLPLESLAQIGGVYPIEADASSASYFIALPVIATAGGKLTLFKMPFPFEDPKSNLQGDGRNFIDVMKRVGAVIEPHSEPEPDPTLKEFLQRIFLKSKFSTKKAKHISFSTKKKQYDGITVEYNNSNARGKGAVQEFREFSDTFLTLAAIAPLLTKPTKITGIGHTRKQETNRIEAMATELKKIIGDDNIVKTDDSLEILPVSPKKLKALVKSRKGIVKISTYSDHRVAMSFAILGCYDLLGNGDPWLAIKDPGCCAKTFPNFFEVLEKIRAESIRSQ